MIETVGLLIGAAQSDPRYRGLSAARAGQHAGGDGVWCGWARLSWEHERS